MGLSDEMLMEFESNMVKTFEMLDLGPLKYFLGLEVKQFRGSLFVSPQKYSKDLLEKTGLLHYKSMASPINSNEKQHSLYNSRTTNPT